MPDSKNKNTADKAPSQGSYRTEMRK